MTLRYDFDMVAMTLEGLPDAFANLEMTGIGAEKVAMFRDPETMNALSQADAAVQSFFTQSGFALQTFDSGAPPGRFLQRDEEARLRIIDNLTRNLGTHNLEGADWGGFVFSDFMQALSQAEPLDDDRLLAPALQSHGVNRELRAAHDASRKLKLRRSLALAGLAAGLALLLFVVTQAMA
jgi:hypothetical protein